MSAYRLRCRARFESRQHDEWPAGGKRGGRRAQAHDAAQRDREQNGGVRGIEAECARHVARVVRE